MYRDKTYRGERLDPETPQRRTVVTVEDNTTRERKPLEHHVLHSPDGFEWGYYGSGPAELARCILWDFLGQEPEPGLYQDFKADAIASIQDDTWMISAAEVAGWLSAQGFKGDWA